MKLSTITIMILLKNLCDYDYDYDYSKMCNRLQSITIIIVIRPNPALEGFQAFVDHTYPASHFTRTVYVMRLHIHCKLCLTEREREGKKKMQNDKFLKTSQNLKVLFPLLLPHL